MADKIEVEVLPAGDGKVFMASNLKALPPAKAKSVITVKGGAYADGPGCCWPGGLPDA
jgi:hypothetical protein